MVQKPKHPAPGGGPGREMLDVFMSKGKTGLVLAVWAALLFVMIWVFILPYRAMAGDAGRQFPNRLAALLGDEVFLITGIVICGLILWYMATLTAQLLFKGPLYRVSREGLWLLQADRFFIPRKFIHSLFFGFRQGFATSVVLEVNDRKVLRDLQKRLPKLAGITCNPDQGYCTIELAGLKNKKTFTRALAGLTSGIR